MLSPVLAAKSTNADVNANIVLMGTDTKQIKQESEWVSLLTHPSAAHNEGLPRCIAAPQRHRLRS